MADQQELPKSGCFSSFKRLLLCAHSNHVPPIHPSDHLPQPPPSQTLSSLPNKPPLTPNPISTTPGVVARLMGLDSLPNTSRISNRVAPESVPRSKSVNFVDYLLQFDLAQQQGSHRRVRTSSFREVPASSLSSFQPQNKNHEVVVFFWDENNGSKSKSSAVVRPTTRKSEVGCKEARKQRKEKEKEKNEGKKKKKISKLKNEPRRVSVSTRTENYGYRNGGSSSSSSRISGKEAFVEPKFRKRVGGKKSFKKMQNECCSENLSPVSVLEVDDDDFFTFANEALFTDETSPLSSKSKRKSSAKGYFGESVEDRGSNQKGNAYPEVNSQTEYWSVVMTEICKLAESDVKESRCKAKAMFGSESLEEICLHFEHKIFDLLLREVVEELVEF